MESGGVKGTGEGTQTKKIKPTNERTAEYEEAMTKAACVLILCEWIYRISFNNLYLLIHLHICQCPYC